MNDLLTLPEAMSLCWVTSCILAVPGVSLENQTVQSFPSDLSKKSTQVQLRLQRIIPSAQGVYTL